MPSGGNHNKEGKGPMNIQLLGNEDEKAMVIRRSLENLLDNFDKEIVKNEEEGYIRTQEYIESCINRSLRPTVEGWALALGTTRSSLWDWETGRRQGPLSADFVKKGKELLAAFDADMVNQSKINPVAYIFRAKNYYGMKDQQDIVITPKQEIDSEQLIREAELLPDYDEDE